MTRASRRSSYVLVTVLAMTICSLCLMQLFYFNLRGGSDSDNNRKRPTLTTIPNNMITITTKNQNQSKKQKNETMLNRNRTKKKKMKVHIIQMDTRDPNTEDPTVEYGLGIRYTQYVCREKGWGYTFVDVKELCHDEDRDQDHQEDHQDPRPLRNRNRNRSRIGGGGGPSSPQGGAGGRRDKKYCNIGRRLGHPPPGGKHGGNNIKATKQQQQQHHKHVTTFNPTWLKVLTMWYVMEERAGAGAGKGGGGANGDGGGGLTEEGQGQPQGSSFGKDEGEGEGEEKVLYVFIDCDATLTLQSKLLDIHDEYDAQQTQEIQKQKNIKKGDDDDYDDGRIITPKTKTPPTRPTPHIWVGRDTEYYGGLCAGGKGGGGGDGASSSTYLNHSNSSPTTSPSPSSNSSRSMNQSQVNPSSASPSFHHGHHGEKGGPSFFTKLPYRACLSSGLMAMFPTPEVRRLLRSWWHAREWPLGATPWGSLTGIFGDEGLKLHGELRNINTHDYSYQYAPHGAHRNPHHHHHPPTSSSSFGSTTNSNLNSKSNSNTTVTTTAMQHQHTPPLPLPIPPPPVVKIFTHNTPRNNKDKQGGSRPSPNPGFPISNVFHECKRMKAWKKREDLLRHMKLATTVNNLTTQKDGDGDGQQQHDGGGVDGGLGLNGSTTNKKTSSASASASFADEASILLMRRLPRIDNHQINDKKKKKSTSSFLSRLPSYIKKLFMNDKTKKKSSVKSPLPSYLKLDPQIVAEVLPVSATDLTLLPLPPSNKPNSNNNPSPNSNPVRFCETFHLLHNQVINTCERWTPVLDWNRWRVPQSVTTTGVQKGDREQDSNDKPGGGQQQSNDISLSLKNASSSSSSFSSLSPSLSCQEQQQQHQQQQNQSGSGSGSAVSVSSCKGQPPGTYTVAGVKGVYCEDDSALIQMYVHSRFVPHHTNGLGWYYGYGGVVGRKILPHPKLEKYKNLLKAYDKMSYGESPLVSPTHPGYRSRADVERLVACAGGGSVSGIVLVEAGHGWARSRDVDSMRQLLLDSTPPSSHDGADGGGRNGGGVVANNTNNSNLSATMSISTRPHCDTDDVAALSLSLKGWPDVYRGGGGGGGKGCEEKKKKKPLLMKGGHLLRCDGGVDWTVGGKHSLCPDGHKYNEDKHPRAEGSATWLIMK